MKKKFVSFIMVFSLAVLVASVVLPNHASAMESNRTSAIQSKVSDSQIMEPQAIPFAKQILVKALRVGGPYLGNLIKKIPYKWAEKAGDACAKYGHKAADVIDEITNFGEVSVTIALVKAGIPLADAQMIAQVIVFFLL